jgi:peptidoglycan/LPS O-acetylase OafA/YrhL
MVHAWGLSGSLSFNYPSWSISAEMFAYALFPIMALFVLRFRLWIVGLTAFVLLSLLAIIAREWLGSSSGAPDL